MRLADFLDHVAAGEFAYGRCDCATLMADWLMARGWPDAMADRRGSYATERQYRAAVRSEGGLVASCRMRFGRLGLLETSAPAEGDVALALAPVAVRSGSVLSLPVGGIVLDRGIVVVLMRPRGVAGAKLPIVSAWRVARA